MMFSAKSRLLTGFVPVVTTADGALAGMTLMVNRFLLTALNMSRDLATVRLFGPGCWPG